MKKKRRAGLRESFSEDELRSAKRLVGLSVAIFAVFTLLSIVSYVFHWAQDMSGEAPANAAGSLGHGFGHLLVAECFGLGSLAFLAIISAVAAGLLSDKWRLPLSRTFVLSLLWAFVSSLALGYIGNLLSLQNAFGGGLGGWCGGFVASWLKGATGPVISGLIILLVILVLLAFSSGKFVVWLSSLGSGRKEEESEYIRSEEEESPQETTGETVPEAVAVPVPALAEVQDKKSDGTGTFEIIKDEGGLSTEVEEKLPRINNRLDPPEGLPRYRFPDLDLLGDYSSDRHTVSDDELARNNNKIRTTLANYKIRVADVKAIVGPTVTLYKVYPDVGVTISQIRTRQDDIAMSLNAKGVRLVLLGDSVGIEVANDSQSIVPVKALLNDAAFRTSTAELPIAIGYTITQKVKVFDLADAPHLLVAGATKQGKSVGLNVLVSSLLYAKHPSELKFVFIDPKMVEFTAYKRLLKHYLAVLPDAGDADEEADNAIVKNPKDAERILRSLCIEMDERYTLLSKAGVNKLTNYNSKYLDRKLNPEHGHRFLPYLVVIVDEYADLTMTTGASPESKAAGRSITNSIIRLAQKGRAAGIHVIIATQRPSVDVISGLIKSNFPMRIAFRTSQRVDSNTILDQPGAEKLIGNGDMLIYSGIDTERLQCGYIDTREVNAITEFVGAQVGYGQSYNTPYYLPSVEEAGAGGSGQMDMSDLDERFADAARMVVTTQKGSTSDIQRRLGMGYAKAGRVMDQLEAAGIVGPQEGSKPRQVLVSDLDSLEEILKAYTR